MVEIINMIEPVCFQIDQGEQAGVNRQKHWLGWKWGVSVKLLDMNSTMLWAIAC